MKLDVTNLRNRTARDRWNRVSMGDLFERLTWHDPDKVVIEAWEGAYESPENAQMTASRADRLANQYANGILSSGISPGRIVMMVCENSVEAILAKIGLAKAGVTVAPVNPNLSEDVIGELVELCEPAAIVIDSQFHNKIQPIVEKFGLKILHHINVGSGHYEPSFAKFVAPQPEKEPEVDIGGDDIWELLFTSGSTSAPKGVMVSHHNTMYVGLSFNGLAMNGVDYESDLAMVSFLPVIYHVGDGLIYNAIMSGGKIVIGRKFNPRELAQAISKHKINCLWGGAPQAIEAVTAEFKKDSSLNPQALRTIIFGWAPLNPKLYDEVKQVLGNQVKLIEIIGQTEVCCAHRFWLEKHIELYRGTAPQENYVGEPHGLLASMIANDKNEPILFGDSTVGEAIYRSPSLMAGYYKKPEDTAKAFEGGWFHGGDAFKWGESKQRILADRFKDIIKSGGENVTCIRVEAILGLHPGVQRAILVGLPHHRWGEAVTAFIIPRPDAQLTEQEILQFVRDKLAPFEMPKKVVFVNSFPETVGGKVQKHILRAQNSALYEEK